MKKKLGNIVFTVIALFISSLLLVLCYALYEDATKECIRIDNITDCRGFSDMQAKDWYKSIEEYKCHK